MKISLSLLWPMLAGGVVQGGPGGERSQWERSGVGGRRKTWGRSAVRGRGRWSPGVGLGKSGAVRVGAVRGGGPGGEGAKFRAFFKFCAFS